jgi:very-short-patch-repair endonuclease
MKFTRHDIEQLQKQGKIRSYTIPPKNNSHNSVKNIPQRSKEKEWLSWNIPYWCNEHCVTLETEFSFHPARKWRFDWAIPALKIAVEYEGIFSEKSRHTTFQGYNADTDKYNTAAAMGWKVIRLTAKNYKTVLNILNNIKI